MVCMKRVLRKGSPFPNQDNARPGPCAGNRKLFHAGSPLQRWSLHWVSSFVGEIGVGIGLKHFLRLCFVSIPEKDGRVDKLYKNYKKYMLY